MPDYVVRYRNKPGYRGIDSFLNYISEDRWYKDARLGSASNFTEDQAKQMAERFKEPPSCGFLPADVCCVKRQNVERVTVEEILAVEGEG